MVCCVFCFASVYSILAIEFEFESVQCSAARSFFGPNHASSNTHTPTHPCTHTHTHTHTHTSTYTHTAPRPQLSVP
ncbi:hypothetical protein EDD21DRAFT_230086 [Dissophora ornata]|nr:hypothetical protein EDD21DRAFT_230086 [Dissophora ornata]